AGCSPGARPFLQPFPPSTRLSAGYPQRSSMPAAVPMLAVMVVVQAYGSPTAPAGKPAEPSATTVVARRALRGVVIDGKDDDEVWREAPAITALDRKSVVRERL